MTHCLKSASLLAFAALLPAAHAATLDVFVDPAQTWWGYVAVFDLPGDGGALRLSEFYGADTARLPGGFAGPVASLAPSRIGVFEGDTQNPYFGDWWKADGNGGYSANKIVEGYLYVQDDSLAGNTVRFSGRVLSNTLTGPYTAYAVIADTVGDNYAGYAQARSTPLVAGETFTVSLDVALGHHVGYGIVVSGPGSPDASLGSLGAVAVSAVPEPSTWLLMAIGGFGLAALRRRS